MGATLIVRRLVWAWMLQFCFLLYCFRCCLFFFLDSHLVLLRVPLCQFCSSTVELYPWPIIVCIPFFIHQPISVHFPYMEVSLLWLAPFISSFLLWTLSTPDWLLHHSVPRLGLPFKVHSILLYSTPHCIISLVSSTQSSVLSSPNLEGNRPLRDFSVPSAPAHASLHSSLSLMCDGTLNLVAFAFRTQASFVIVTRTSPSHLHPKARFDAQC